MQVLPYGDLAYVAHLGPSGTDIVDIRDPRHPALLTNIPAPPGTHSHKVQTGNGLLLVNRERWQNSPTWTAGFDVYDIANPREPRLIAEWRTPGSGVHRIWFTDDSPLAYISASVPGFTNRILVILDLSNPSVPREIGRWWLPGMNVTAGETPTWDPNRECLCHHAVVHGNRAYVSWWDLGMVILDVSDPAQPGLVAHLTFPPNESGATHSVLPLGGWLAVADEAIEPWPETPVKRMRLIDARDERRPRVRTLFPEPADAAECRTPGLRYGPHNFHENRPGTFRSKTQIFATYYSAGLRGYEIAPDGSIQENTRFLPPTQPGQAAAQSNDLVVREDGLILVTDRVSGGLTVAGIQ